MINHNQSIVTNGLVFAFDAKNPKSYKGGATTNYAVDTNPRLTDTSYSIWVGTSSGTWPQKHNDAIQVFNVAGSDISNYINSGVGDWTNTYHAIWTYDQELCRPVVTMRDFDSMWKAKTFGLGSMTSMGLSAGMKYTISWLQWTDNASLFGADVGIYGPDTGGTYNFHDGRQTVANTKIRTWQRVYATYTVSAARNMAGGVSCYMYGMSAGVGTTMKISDVQVEVGDHPTAYTATSTRTASQSFIDLTGNNTITAPALTYASDGTFTFNGSTDWIEMPTSTVFDTQQVTIESWCKPTTTTQNGFLFEKGQVNTQYSLFFNGSNITFRTMTLSTQDLNFVSATYLSTTKMNCITATYANGLKTLYVNGVQVAQATVTGTLPVGQAGQYIGRYGSGAIGSAYPFSGTIDITRVYNRALTSSEVMQNFSAHRGRYGV